MQFVFLSTPPSPPSFAWMFSATHKCSWWGQIRITDLQQVMETFFLPKLKTKNTHVVLCL